MTGQTWVPRQAATMVEIKGMVMKLDPYLRRILPKAVGSERLLRTALVTIRNNPRLLECDPVSLLGSILEAAHAGLELDGFSGQAYLIPRWNKKRGCLEAVFQAGYRGLIALCYRGNKVAQIVARPVWEGDTFSYELGTNPQMRHIPAKEPCERISENVRAAYAIAWLTDSQMPVWIVLERVDLDRVQAFSEADKGPWVTDYAAMACKSAIRALWRWLPLSASDMRIGARDELLDRGAATPGDDIIDGTEALDAIVASVKPTTEKPGNPRRPTFQAADDPRLHRAAQEPEPEPEPTPDPAVQVPMEAPSEQAGELNLQPPEPPEPPVRQQGRRPRKPMGIEAPPF